MLDAIRPCFAGGIASRDTRKPELDHARTQAEFATLSRVSRGYPVGFMRGLYSGRQMTSEQLLPTPSSPLGVPLLITRPYGADLLALFVCSGSLIFARAALVAFPVSGRADPAIASYVSRRTQRTEGADDRPGSSKVTTRGCSRCCARHRYWLLGWERMVHRTYLGAHWCSRCQRNGLLSSGFSVVNAARRFPPPWSVDAGFNCGVAKLRDLVKDLARRVRGLS
jgi:hypothetical protein